MVEGSGAAMGSAKRKSSMATTSSLGLPRVPSERMVLTPEVRRCRDAEEGLALVAVGEDVAGKDEGVGLVEELNGGGVGGFDVGEDGGEGGGGGGGAGSGEEEGDVGDIAVDGGEDALGAEGGEVIGEAEEWGW